MRAMSDAIVWISGASAGLGAALAASVPFAGARVIDISRSGGAAGTEHLPADLADPASWAAVEEHFAAQLGGFEGSRAVFVHNAGVITPVGFAGEVDSAAYRAHVLLNSAAPQVLGHAFLRALDGFGGRADLVMLTSGAARNPYEGWSGYCAGKAAVDHWVRTVGAEQARRGGCRVVAVAPGVLATGMQEAIRGADPRDFPAVAKFHDLHERGDLRAPADAAQGVWRLLERDLDNGAVVDLRALDG
jgi:benzil reductase ((S)-benzoin forming)